MASDSYFKSDLEDPELKGDVDYSFFGEDDQDEILDTADGNNKRNNFKNIPMERVISSRSASPSDSSDSLDSSRTSTKSSKSNRSEEKPIPTEVAASHASASSLRSKSSSSTVKKSNSVRNESPNQHSSKSRKSNSKSPPHSSRSSSPPLKSSSSSSSSSKHSKSRSPSRSPIPNLKSKSHSRTPSPTSKSQQLTPKSPSRASSSTTTTSKSKRESPRSPSRASSSSSTTTEELVASKKSTSRSASKKSSLKEHIPSPGYQKNNDFSPRRRGNHDDSDTTVTSLSEDSPATSPKSGRKSSSRKKRSIGGSQRTTSRNEKEDLNNQRDNDIINAGLVMKAMLALDRERKSKGRSREAWLDPLSRNRNPSEIINVEAENKRLVNYLKTGPNLRSSNNLIVRPHHSTINRQEYQRRIEFENGGMINRLNAIHPTPGMRRTDQLMFYRVQSGYGVIPMDKAPLRRDKVIINPIRKLERINARRRNANSAKYPKTFEGALSSRPEWDSGW